MTSAFLPQFAVRSLASREALPSSLVRVPGEPLSATAERYVEVSALVRAFAADSLMALGSGIVLVVSC